MTNFYPESYQRSKGTGQPVQTKVAPQGMQGKRRVLAMLQGHPSGFWRELGAALRRDGHEVVKVHFGLGDRVYWGNGAARNYRGSFADWPTYLDRLVSDCGVTDILYYADRLPYHAAALNIARKRGIYVWAIEFGYLRPDWLTFEPDGMGAISTFPKTRAAIERLATAAPAPDMVPRYRHSFGQEAFQEVCFALLQTFGRPLYPFYRSDKQVWPAIDYLSWLPVLASARRRETEAAALTERIVASRQAFNLVAMQIEADYQIRASSPYGSLRDFCAEVIASFAAHAPADRSLVFKIHPLDNGLSPWFRAIPALTRDLGVANRVHVIRGGDLGRLLYFSSGVVLVNSTVGIHALRQGVPVCAMGTAIYDLPGLTHQSGLDTFWSAPEPVDTDFYPTFERALSTIQIKGSFFDRVGRSRAIDAIVESFRPERGMGKKARTQTA